MKKKLNLAALLLAAALLGACGGQKQDAADTVAPRRLPEAEGGFGRLHLERPEDQAGVGRTCPEGVRHG